MSETIEKSNTFETTQNDNSDSQSSINEASESMQNSELLLFFSFDIVNSTQYKSVTTKWPIILKNLLDAIKNQISSSTLFSNCSLWRVIGDELIFIVPVYGEEELLEIVNGIFRIEQFISSDLKSGIFFDKINSQIIDRDEIEILKAQNLLSVKVTAWIASVRKNDSSNPYDNISTIYSPSTLNGTSIVEYLGKDIDTGFRLKEYSYRNQMAVSIELAYLLSKHESILSCLHIMEYVSLKGVWNNDLYPIVWFYKETDSELPDQISFDNSFRYNDINQNEIIKAYFHRKNNTDSFLGNLNPEMYTNTAFALSKVIDDQGLTKKMNYLTQILKEIHFTFITHPGTQSNLELHCAVVCCNTKNKTIFITHRSSEHSTNPLKWEFGCAKANNLDSLSSVITDYYHNVYGLEITLIMNKERDERQPIPIAVYEIRSNSGGFPKKGIIFVAKVSNPPVSNHCTSEHDQFQWISETKIGSIKPEEAIPDFHNTLKYVFTHFNELFDSTKGSEYE